jgi:hypothetical protein
MQRSHRGLENELVSICTTAVRVEFECFPSRGESLFVSITLTMVHTIFVQ